MVVLRDGGQFGLCVDNKADTPSNDPVTEVTTKVVFTILRLLKD